MQAHQSEQETQVQGMTRDLVQAWSVPRAEEHVQVQEARRAEMTAIASSQQELTSHLNQEQVTLQRTPRDREALREAQSHAAERQGQHIEVKTEARTTSPQNEL